MLFCVKFDLYVMMGLSNVGSDKPGHYGEMAILKLKLLGEKDITSNFFIDAATGALNTMVRDIKAFNHCISVTFDQVLNIILPALLLL